jgi:glycosyltransferase involved in cell wall biosynthesis
MKVLVVHNRYRSVQPSGENAVVDEETGLLLEQGCRVERLEVESDEIEKWPFYRKALLPAGVVWSRRGARLVEQAIRSARPDVVHFHNTFPVLSPAALHAAKRTGVPVVMTLHNFRPLCAAGTFLRGNDVCEDCLHSRIPAAAVRHACYRNSRAASVPVAAMIAVHRQLGTWVDSVDRIIVPSHFARSKYVGAGWPAEKLVVKYNTATDPSRARTGAGTGFVAISRLSREKGLDTLVDAWRLAFPDGEETLTIVGSGEEDEALRSRASGSVGISFAGGLPREEAMAILASARALVIPSRWYEVFPRIVVEAYSLSVPVVASRIGSLSEVVQDGETGILFDPGHAESLAASLRSLSTSPELSRRLGARARERYEVLFAPLPTMEVLLATYRDALASSMRDAATLRPHSVTVSRGRT